MPKLKETPAQIIKRLEREPSHERLKDEIINQMIDLSDKQYGTGIRKKFSPKQFEQQTTKPVNLSGCCRLFGISRQSLFQAKIRYESRAEDLALIKPKVDETRRKMPRLGSENMLIKPLKSYTKTTHSKHWLKKHPNLLKGVMAERPEEYFISDITFIKSRERTHYLFLVSDAYSRKDMGYSFSDDISAENVVRALNMAIRERKTNLPLVHHFNRGLQYCSAIYLSKLKSNGMKPSMADGYDCYQKTMQKE